MKMTLQKLSLSPSGTGICPSAVCVGRRRRPPCSSTRCNCAALATTCTQPGSPKGQAAARQPSSGVLPLAFPTCVFQTVQESGARCPARVRSSSRGRPALLQPPAFCPSCSGYKSPASQAVRLRKTTGSQVLDYSIATAFPFAPSPTKIP